MREFLNTIKGLPDAEECPLRDAVCVDTRIAIAAALAV
jgi:predicted adenine nucleotide alpha hydrolase (AANH) superfamily ATPase